MSVSTHLRRRSAVAALGCALVGGALVAGLAAAFPAVAATSPAASASTHPAGPIGSSVLLASAQNFAGYDVAANADGTAYIGWISTDPDLTDRQVHLCTLPVGATRCSGGVQTIDSLDVASAANLRVLATPAGHVTLVWFDEGSGSGSQSGEVVEATASHGLNLSAAQVIASAPSHGQMFDAEFGPDGSIWTVTYSGVPVQTVQIRDGAKAFTTASTPFGVGFAQLAFVGNRPVLAVEKDGAITEAAYYSTMGTGGSWATFRRVSDTWTPAGADLVTTRHGLRMITTVDSSSYRPVIASWNGHGFDRRRLTADRNSCGPSTHDGATDGSGRLLDVAWECGHVTIADYVNDSTAAIVRFPVRGTGTFAPQIASGTQGIATVAWTTQATTGDSLRVFRVRLPDTTRTVSVRGTGGRVTVIGPTSCVPPVDVSIGLSARAARGWSIGERALRLGTSLRHGHLLDGSRLTPGKAYTLRGTVVFTDGSRRSRVRAELAIRACPTS